jgi:hypothetical protein
MINDVETNAAENYNAINEFVEQTRLDINEAYNEFLLAFRVNNGCEEDVCEDSDCEKINISQVSSILYNNFVEQKTQFSGNTFIEDKFSFVDGFIADLENISLLIDNDGVITETKKHELNGKISLLVDELSQYENNDIEKLVNEFQSGLNRKYNRIIRYFRVLIEDATEGNLTLYHQNKDSNTIIDGVSARLWFFRYFVYSLETLRDYIIENETLRDTDKEVLLAEIDEYLIEGRESLASMEQQERQRPQRPPQRPSGGSGSSGGGSAGSSGSGNSGGQGASGGGEISGIIFLCPLCDWVFVAGTQEEGNAKRVAHLKDEHGYSEVSPP